MAKPRTSKHLGYNYTYLEKRSAKEKFHLESLLTQLLQVPAFELGIAALYTFKALGKSIEDLQQLVQTVPSPEAEPYRNIVFYLNALESDSAPVVVNELATEDEPDETMEWH